MFYFLSIIDYYSMFSGIYLHKSKYEAFDKFKLWKVHAETELNYKDKALRFDNGLEFYNEIFDSFCAENKIKGNKTIRLTPQQNGII